MCDASSETAPQPATVGAAGHRDDSLLAAGALGGPVLLAPPGLHDDPVIGRSCAADPGRWSEAGACAFQWFRDGAPIRNATAATYIPMAEDDCALLSVRVTATGAGGVTEATSRGVPVKQVPPTATVFDVLDEVHDAGTGVTFIDAAPYFRGESLCFSAAGAGAEVDPATGTVALPLDTPLVEEMMVMARNSGGEAVVRFRVTVESPSPLPAAASASERIDRRGNLRPLFRDQAAAAASTRPASGHAFIEGVDRVGTSETPSGTNDIHDTMRPLSLAWHAAAGGIAHDARLVAMVKRVLNIPNAGLRQEGGYGQQHESPLLGAIAIVRNIPRLWAGFNADERTRARMIVETGAWAPLVMISDTNPYVSGEKEGPERPLRGRDSVGTGRRWNPNYRLSNTAGIAAAIAFHSADGEDGGAIMEGKRRDYSFHRHRDALREAGLVRAFETWDRRWTSSFSEEEIENTIRSFAHFGMPFSEWVHIVVNDTNDCFGGHVTSGLKDGEGILVDGERRGRIMQGADGLPHPLGTPGMAKEYDTMDGGGQLGLPNLRSSARYVTLGLKIALCVWAPLIVAGQVDRSHVSTGAVWDRMRVGFDDHQYKWGQGYYNYSHGGTVLGNWKMDGPSAFSGNSAVWGKAHWFDGLWPAMRAWFFDD